MGGRVPLIIFLYRWCLFFPKQYIVQGIAGENCTSFALHGSGMEYGKYGMGHGFDPSLAYNQASIECFESAGWDFV